MKKVNQALINEDQFDEEEEEYQNELDEMLAHNYATKNARQKKNVKNIDDYDEDEDEDLQELPEDWNEDDEAQWENEDDDEDGLGELTEEEYEKLLMKIQSAPTFLLNKKQLKKFWDNVNNQYYDTLSSEKGKKSPHERKVDFDSLAPRIKGKF